MCPHPIIYLRDDILSEKDNENLGINENSNDNPGTE